MSSDLIAGHENDKEIKGRPTGMPGWDWIFDGGIPQWGTVLLCAKGGTGKSTLLWELGKRLSVLKLTCLYLSSEQSKRDLRRQFSRCGAPPNPEYVLVHHEKNYEKIIDTVEQEEPDILMLDSLHEIENVTDDAGFNLATGGPAAVTRIARRFKELSEDMDMFSILIGHMNVDGTMSGGSHLRHAVDGTLEMSRNADKKDPRRYLEFKDKSRFGILGRRALLEMGQDGIKDCGPADDTKEEQQQQSESAPKESKDFSKMN